MTRGGRAALCVLTVVWTLAGLAPSRAAAQGAPEALGGAAIGAVGGTIVTAAVITTASLDEVYLWDTRDLIGWPLVPIAAGLVGGAVQGSTDWDSVERGTRHALALGVVGTALGALAGELLIEDDRGPWAGGVIGAGAGVLAGWLIGSLSEDEAMTMTASIPLGLSW